MREGIPYTELMLFANVAGTVDLYMRVSTWTSDTWALYVMDDVVLPEELHRCKSMRHLETANGSIGDVYEKKRKRDEAHYRSYVDTAIRAFWKEKRKREEEENEVDAMEAQSAMSEAALKPWRRRRNGL